MITNESGSEAEFEETSSKPEKRKAITLKNAPYGLVEGVKRGSSGYGEHYFIVYNKKLQAKLNIRYSKA